jgi:aminocarboxymuconate-semialdehyde decarboxylase
VLEHPPIVDFHAHVLTYAVLDEAGPRSVASGFGSRPVRPPAGSPGARSFELMTSPEVQLEDMDAHGIDRHVLAPVTVMQSTSWAEPGVALRLSQALNDETARWVAAHPTRFSGMAALPLQDMHLAIGELRRAVDELGLQVLQLPAQINGVYLGDATLRPLWEAISELGITVFLHPDGTKDLWFQQYAMWNSIGQSIEECKAMASLILEGIFDDFEGLRIVVAHGGGFLPHYASRLDRIAQIRPEAGRVLRKLPSEYLSDFYYDTCVYEPDILATLIDRVGAGRIVMGSDYPVGGQAPMPFLTEECRGILPESELPQIFGGRAIELLSPRRAEN